MDKFLTIKQAAKILNIHWQTIRNYINEGKLQVIKIGRTIRIAEESINKLVNKTESKNKREIELRFILNDKLRIENKVRALGAQLTNHSHIIDHWYCDNNISNIEEKDIFYDSPTGYSLRIREVDNDYSGIVTRTLENKKLAGPDFKDHSNCIEAEIIINDFDEAEKLILMMNKKKFATIDKERFVYRLNDIKFCFDTVKGYGDGLEIEKVTTEDVEVVKKELLKIAKKIGLSEKNMPKNSFTYEIMRHLAKF